MALPLLPIAGALAGGLFGYLGAPDDNKLGATITGGLIGGLTGGIGGTLAKGLVGAKTAGTTASSVGRMANSSWNPVTLLKSAYTPDAGGLINLGMDALPLITDIANNDVGLKSFTGFAGTMAGTRFGGRELNKAGEEALNSGVLNRAQTYNKAQSARAQKGITTPMESVEDYTNRYKSSMTNKLLNDPTTSRQGYNMGIGMGADIGLYSLTSGMSKPKDPMESQLRQQQDFYDSPVSRYIQMTGAL